MSGSSRNMKISYSRVFKVLCATSLAFFIVGFTIPFLPTVYATVTDVREESFHQGGYAGLPHPSFLGGTSTLLFVTYEYEIDSKAYDSWGIAADDEESKVAVKYLPFAPSITFSSSAPYFVFCGLFLFLAIGVRNIVVWCTKLLRKYGSR